MAVLPFPEFSASQNGVLVYGSSALYQVQLVWRNREGTRQDSIGTPGIYAEARLSPDEKRLVVTRRYPGNRNVRPLDSGAIEGYLVPPDLSCIRRCAVVAE
jgi:hypothetical protein